MVFFLLISCFFGFSVRLYYPFFIFSFFSSSLFFSDFNFSLNTPFSMSLVTLDELGFFMSYITVFVLFVSYIYSFTIPSFFSLLLISIFSICFFITNNLFSLYFFYECSLIPILYIIIVWGSYPERSLSSFILLSYTAIFSIPYIFVIFYVFFNFHSLNFTILSLSMFSSPYPLIFTFIGFLTFSVNLPIYGLHFWLPIAHVEAPTFGSMILAGVLLKLGGVGLVRLSSSNLISTSTLCYYFLSYSLLFILFVTFVCCYQSDFNRLVAYSSVSHIIAIPILVFTNTSFSFNVILMLMFFHGFSSPLLFMFVGVLYSVYSSRQLPVLRGLVLYSPFLSFFGVLIFFFTLSAPPFPSFVSEVLFFSSTIHLTPYIFLSFFLFAFLSLLYNLNWLSSILFSHSTSNISYSTILFSFLFSFNICFLFSFFMLFLFAFF